jgi:outer membrane receptor for ferrienterochelin and colicin
MIFSFFTIDLYAQNSSVKGKVNGIGENNEQTPLPKATIRWLGTSTGTYSNEIGEFKIERSAKTDTLMISFLGYKTDTLFVSKNSNNLIINLKNDLTTDEVQVTGKSPQALISTSDVINNQTITGRGLQKAACCNLAESFVTNAAADVEFTDAVSGARQIKLLGLQGTLTQLLTENVPAMRGLASSFGLGYIPGPWMKSISISKGTASVVNGFEAITGQINVEYKQPEDNKPITLNFFGDQLGRIEVNADEAYKINDKLSTMVFLNGNLNKFDHDFNNDGFTDHPLVQQINFFNRWNYSGVNHESVSSAQFIFEDRQGGQTNYLRNNDPNSYGIDITTKRFQAFTKNGFFLSSDNNSSIGTILSYTYHSQNSLFGRRMYDAEQNSLYGNIIYESSLGKTSKDVFDQKLKFGASFQIDRFNENIESLKQTDDEYIPGIFTEYSYSGFQDLTLTGGLRADWHNIYGWFATPRFHAKYQITENSVVRLSLGKGSRTAHVLAENTSVLASSRQIIIEPNLNREEAWNYGISTTSEFELFNTDFTLNADFYRTDFINQIIVDMDRSSESVFFTNLNGQSFSNSFQIDLIAEPLNGLIITSAYRYNEVKSMYNGVLEVKPLQSPHRGFLNLAYSTPSDEWVFDFTINYNGPGRIPNTMSSPKEYMLHEEYEGFYTLYGQVTKRFKGWELYFGGENLTDFMQHNPIVAFQDPFGKNFDSSIIWGPVMGRLLYFGIRISNNI